MIDSLLDHFRPGRSIYLPGASGEIIALTHALLADSRRLRGVEITSCLLPGINGFDYAALDPEARVTTFLFPPSLRASWDDGRVNVLPLAYSAIARHLSGRPPFDVAVAHVAPPGVDGRCSLGIASDFTPIAWANARRRIALINPRMPAMPRGPTIALAEADLAVELDSPLIEISSPEGGAEIASITQAAARLVANGATIQVGIGGAPGAMWAALAGHRDLSVASGMVSDGFRVLRDAGALRAGDVHRTGVALGSADFYHWLADSDAVAFATTEQTHDVRTLGLLEQFTAINSAIEVDLFGQINLEWQGGRMVSGVGGAPDFCRAAALSPGGRAMVLMPATARKGSISRIVPRLDCPSASAARSEVDTIVTEHGVAELAGLSVDGRAAALIAIAAPAWRERLETDWMRLRRLM